MNYRKVDATLAAALDEINNAEEPLLAVFIYTAKSRDETATIFLNGIGVRVYSKNQERPAEVSVVNRVERAGRAHSGLIF
jgi:hypothetical protein